MTAPAGISISWGRGGPAAALAQAGKAATSKRPASLSQHLSDRNRTA